MKKLVIRVLISVLAFLFGIAVSRLTTSDTPTVKELPRIETFEQTSRPMPVMTFSQTPTPSPPQVAQPESMLVIDFNVERFQPNGFYTFKGKTPKEFEEFGGFDLSVWNDQGNDRGEILLARTSVGHYLDDIVAFGLVTTDRLFFASRTDDSGFEYRFDGQFLRRGVVSDAPPGKAVLKGKLTKSKNGRTVAESEVSFHIEVHGC